MNATFPNDFVWGTATSAYQIEGASDANGKGKSIWDAYCQIEGNILDGHTGDIACNHVELYKEDVQLLKKMGVKAYRLSISWPRVLPTGRTDSFNKEGMAFYSDLIDELLKYDIQPWVTLYHWDLPQQLEEEMDGWLSPDLPELFAEFSALCFEHLGNRVKHWITINEPWVVAILGYGQGVFAPRHTSDSKPYLVGHHLLLAHAKAVQIYNQKFRENQQGQIGITNNCDWREPKTLTPFDIAAAERALEFFIGWFNDPIYFGDYPRSMKERLGERLPTITDEERELIMGSSDFLGLNHYTTMFAQDGDASAERESVYGNGGLSEDQDVVLSLDPSWRLTTMNWAVVPWGCEKLLVWLAKRYNNPPIYITENGCSLDDSPENGEVNDIERIDYLKGYLLACHSAIQKGVDLKGYFLWSFMDNFEWASGYSKRFGSHYIDFDTLERIPKASAHWYKSVILKNAIEPTS